MWTQRFSVFAVILSANAGSQFRGFLIQARKPSDATMSYGTFDVTGSSMSQTLDCFGETSVSSQLFVVFLKSLLSEVSHVCKIFDWFPPL